MGFSPVNNSSPSGSSPTDNNNLAQALAAIQKQLNDELTWIQQMKDDADRAHSHFLGRGAS